MKPNKEIPNKNSVKIFRNRILRWFNKNKRDYPWRETTDPFKVLIAEMMLRRTKADQVKEVYERLFKKYPDVKSIAEAKIEELKEILYHLGLNWRIQAFSLVAKVIIKKYNFKVPDTREELITLPGVGEYVAGAVLSIAYNKKEWIVDSNIVRLFKRYFGINTSKEGRRDKHVIEMAKMYSSSNNPRKANLAILDFTALICIPRNPNCSSCPLVGSCYYHSTIKKKENK